MSGLQEQLDVKKYYESLEAEKDMSGKMYYCGACKFRSKEGECLTTQENRASHDLCKNAYLALQMK